MPWLTCTEHKETIDVMNKHATIISSQQKDPSQKFHSTFAKFVERLEESDFDDTYLEDKKATSLTHAYWLFLQCVKDECSPVGTSPE